jgi:hypothetical protein
VAARHQPRNAPHGVSTGDADACGDGRVRRKTGAILSIQIPKQEPGNRFVSVTKLAIRKHLTVPSLAPSLEFLDEREDRS